MSGKGGLSFGHPMDKIGKLPVQTRGRWEYHIWEMRITQSWGNYDGEYNWNTEYSVLIPTRCSVETQTKRK
jgi:hypothetical protein